MRRRSAMAACAAAVLGMAACYEARPALAQAVPGGQSCGGLVCDLGLFGHKTAPSEAPAPAPASAPARTADAPPVAPAPQAKPHKPKRLAKVAPASTQAAAATKRAAPAVAARPAAPAMAPAAAPVPAAVAAAAPKTAGFSPRANDGTVYIRANPYTSGLPGPTIITPIGPAPQ